MNSVANDAVAAFSRDLVERDSEDQLRFTKRLLPISELNMSLREPYVTFADTTQEGGVGILNEVQLLRHVEAGGTDQYYHGLLSFPNFRGPGWGFGSISDRTITAGEASTVDASSYFSDPDGDALIYTASSSRTSVATASVSGSTVTVRGVAEGTASIRITATDRGALSAIQTFGVTVEAGSSGAPDLVVQSPAVDDDTPDAAESFTFSATVRNRGEGQSGSTTLRYYRSSNATISSSDTEVGTDPVGALRAGGSSPQTIALTAPSEEGTYYFGACVNSVDGESTTNNNCSEGVEVEVSGGGGTGREGECVKGATYGRGESCDVYGTGSSSKLTFTVLSDGRARLGFITAGNRITMTGTVNGVKYHFVASHQGGGVWKVDEYIP